MLGFRSAAPRSPVSGKVRAKYPRMPPIATPPQTARTNDQRAKVQPIRLRRERTGGLPRPPGLPDPPRPFSVFLGWAAGCGGSCSVGRSSGLTRRSKLLRLAILKDPPRQESRHRNALRSRVSQATADECHRRILAHTERHRARPARSTAKGHEISVFSWRQAGSSPSTRVRGSLNLMKYQINQVFRVQA